jgi:hypothetical protein
VIPIWNAYASSIYPIEYSVDFTTEATPSFPAAPKPLGQATDFPIPTSLSHVLLQFLHLEDSIQDFEK